jgi:hypothetical protein
MALSTPNIIIGSDTPCFPPSTPSITGLVVESGGTSHNHLSPFAFIFFFERAQSPHEVNNQ